MKKEKHVRYTMTHGRLLPAEDNGMVIPFLHLVEELQERELDKTTISVRTIDYSLLPDDSILSLSYRRNDDRTLTIDKNGLFNMDAELLEEVVSAMHTARKDTRPTLSYTHLSQDLNTVTRLRLVYDGGDWYCVLATAISYLEAKLILSLLQKKRLI